MSSVDWYIHLLSACLYVRISVCAHIYVYIFWWLYFWLCPLLIPVVYATSCAVHDYTVYLSVLVYVRVSLSVFCMRVSPYVSAGLCGRVCLCVFLFVPVSMTLFYPLFEPVYADQCLSVCMYLTNSVDLSVCLYTFKCFSRSHLSLLVCARCGVNIFLNIVWRFEFVLLNFGFF